MGKHRIVYVETSLLTPLRHLVNDGVEETPPSSPLAGDESLQKLFVDLTNANVGFKHWHPVAVTANGNKLAGQAEMGGVWEWTSSTLTKQNGFEPMPLYPAYTGRYSKRVSDQFAGLIRYSRLLRWKAQHRSRRLLGNTPPHCWTKIFVSRFES